MIPARFHLLVCLSLVTVSACAGDPVELFPSQESNLDRNDAGDPEETLDDAGDDDPSPGSCEFSAGASSGSTRCVRKTHTRTCGSAGDVRTEIRYNGCDASGYTGDPAETVGNCEQAYAAESGVTSLTELSCHRIAVDDSCCIDHAEAAADSPLFSARVCVPGCANTPSVPGATLTSCAAAYAEADLTLGTHYGLDLIGRGCEGTFLCGSGLTTNPSHPDDPEYNFATSYGHIVFCAHGKLQLITEGPLGISIN